MKKIITQTFTFGPFQSVDVLEDHLSVVSHEGDTPALIYFHTIGEYTIEDAAGEEFPAPAPPPPDRSTMECTKAQAYVVLEEMELLDDVLAMLQDSETPSNVKIGIQVGTEVRRDGVGFNYIAEKLGLDDAARDEFMIKAMAVKL